MTCFYSSNKSYHPNTTCKPDKTVIPFKPLFLGLVFLFLPLQAMAMEPATAMEKYTGVLLADDQGKILYSRNKDKKFIPASILKIFTSLAAIQHFGMNHRFKTIYAHDRTSKNLYIKGFGDPLFISEVIKEQCQQISLTIDTRDINNIIIDQGFFSENIHIPGTGNSLNPYDATTGALCANFNTISFKLDPMTRDYISAEPQTPLLPDFLEDIKVSNQTRGRILLSREQRNLYPGMLIKFFLEKAGIQVKGRVLLGSFPAPCPRVLAFKSPFRLEQVIQKLLRHSNNFIANQLILSMGADKYSPPATLDKGVTALKIFAGKKLGLTDFQIEEGSGLSRKNRISPDEMLTILMEFMPYHTLLRHEGNEYYKTGTLSGVRTRAGFIQGKNKRLYPFVIMVNQKNKSYNSLRRDLLQRVKMLTKDL